VPLESTEQSCKIGTRPTKNLPFYSISLKLMHCDCEILYNAVIMPRPVGRGHYKMGHGVCMSVRLSVHGSFVHGCLAVSHDLNTRITSFTCLNIILKRKGSGSPKLTVL